MVVFCSCYCVWQKVLKYPYTLVRMDIDPAATINIQWYSQHDRFINNAQAVYKIHIHMYNIC